MTTTQIFRNHNTKFYKHVYIWLRELQTELLDKGVKLSLNDVLQGCIINTYKRGLGESDLENFKYEMNNKKDIKT